MPFSSLLFSDTPQHHDDKPYMIKSATSRLLDIEPRPRAGRADRRLSQARCCSENGIQLGQRHHRHQYRQASAWNSSLRRKSAFSAKVGRFCTSSAYGLSEAPQKCAVRALEGQVNDLRCSMPPCSRGQHGARERTASAKARLAVNHR